MKITDKLDLQKMNDIQNDQHNMEDDRKQKNTSPIHLGISSIFNFLIIISLKNRQ